MRDIYSNIYKGLIIASIISFIIGSFSASETTLNSYITGYSILGLGIMMILIIMFNNIINVKILSPLQIFYDILLNTGPFLLTLGVIIFELFLIIDHKKNIVENRVSPSYKSFSNITILLILVQLYVIYTIISTPKFIEYGKIDTVTSGVLYLIGVLSGISSVITFTILTYFTTDG